MRETERGHEEFNIEATEDMGTVILFKTLGVLRTHYAVIFNA